MAVSIIGSRFTNLQSRIQAIYGTLYGQTTRSSSVDVRTADPKGFSPSSNVDYSTDRISFSSAHGWSTGDFAEYDPEGNNPIIGNLVEDAHYFIDVINNNTIELYYDEDLTQKVNLINVGSSGTHFINRYPSKRVEASDFFNLYLDVAAARIHQIGSTYVIPNDALLITGDSIEESYLAAIESLMTSVEADRFLIADPEQVDLINLVDGTGTSINSTRTTAWNGTITHEFTFRFTSSLHGDGFWNAGGELRLSQTLSGGSGTKTGDWKNMLNAPNGVIETTISRTGVSIQGTGSTNSILPFDLTSSYQVIVERTGASYAVNRFRIYARRNSANEFQFLVEFADLDNPPGFGIDENVNGTLASSIQVYNPNGTFSVGGTTYNTVSFSPTGLLLSSL